MANLPQYTQMKKKGNIGEALVQYILSDFCLVHKIDGSYDIGNDMVCELLQDRYPTNLLFYVQVKNYTKTPDLKKQTKEYWKGSPIPVYLFWVKNIDHLGQISNLSYEDISNRIKYKRYTPILHNERKHKNEKFQPFNKEEFLKHLIYDYARCQYVKGFTPIIRSTDFLIFDQKIKLNFSKYLYFIEKVIPEYKDKILRESWVSFLTTAILLYKENNIKKLDLAYQSILLAKEALSYGRRPREGEQNWDFSYSYDWLQFIGKYEKKIEKKLKESKTK